MLYFVIQLLYSLYSLSPVGLSDCVSFNAAVPPSPIPANTNIRSYVRTEVPASNRCTADIIIRPPEEGYVQ